VGSTAAVAALLASARPLANPHELATLLRRQADPLPCPTPLDDPALACTDGTENGFYGHGLVDARNAVSARQD
jgi:hypothetical protein